MRLCPGLVALFLLAAGPPARPAPAQRADTSRAVRVVEPAGRPAPPTVVRRETRTPRGALRRALVAPGWGQFYNGQPLKAPVVWGVLGGFGAGVALTHRQYRTFGRAYVYRVCTEAPASCREPDFERYADDAARYDGYRPEVLRAERDRLRRNRDLLALGVGLGYALQALDAYVAGHLLDFDANESLSLTLVPTPAGPYAGVRRAWRLP